MAKSTRKQREALSDAVREAYVDASDLRTFEGPQYPERLYARIIERIADALEAEDPDGFNRAGWVIAADGAKKLRILRSLSSSREEQR